MDRSGEGRVHSLGRYEVVGPLASGGMAEVFLCRVKGPAGFERPVVVKRILPHLARQPAFVSMFLDEARTIARIHHPNVVHVHELGSQDGDLFMAMEYLQGESVSSLMRRMIGRNLTLDPRLAAFIVSEACAGLHAAHELRAEDGSPLHVVHRDVSPQNLIVTYEGTIKILDFGIAKTADRVTRTEAGELKGKLEFMSPEQCKSEPLDRRTDVFALGVVLYELLTHRRLFKRPSPAGTIKSIVSDPIVPPSRVASGCPPSLDSICLRALERDREKRYATALDMRRELVSAIGALPAPGGQLPEEQLAALMQSVLADRRDQKDEMLRHVREGTMPGNIPSPEVDESEDVDIPVVAAPGDGTNANVTSALRTAAPGRRWPMVLVVSAVGIIAGAVVWGRSRQERPMAAQALPAIPVATASVVASAAATSNPNVGVAIDSDPPGASVSIDGVPMGATPVTLSLARTADRHTLLLHKDGFADDREDLAGDVEQRVRFSLKPVARPAPRPGAPAAHKPSDQPPSKW